MKKVKVIVIVETITNSITNRMIDNIARPIAKSFWEKLDEIDNFKPRNIDMLVEKNNKYVELEEEFKKLPEWLQQYIGNSKKSDFI